ncbi:uncharacterized protein STEHIDRAFT_154543 [Stereum hirsutum FP-91666 SS1]|uniref:uncharacterized protein n=1 Tax=Stereum hirsutum (strain FP-91666) TaxID=721885 RepID=UPI000440D019|nr:uncharacterized protein STEHIDRAFT_154543 [Stereum hirsutum FP-91666 SS1]EIM88825.1 hypothetical protein STEHIDRAFT_154543 [Stereum hirsutum FP-91666 SS1]
MSSASTRTYETITLPAPKKYDRFIWTPLAHPPRVLIPKAIRFSSSVTVHPPYIGAKSLAKHSAKWVDQRLLLYGWAIDTEALERRGELEGYSVDEIGKANVLDRFGMILRDVCGLDPDKDFLPVLLSDGTHAMCVVLAQNLTRETMQVDEEKGLKVMMLLATSTRPRWYQYAWNIDHDGDSD